MCAPQVYPLHNLESWLWCARMANNRTSAERALARLDALASEWLPAGLPQAGWNLERFAAQHALTRLHFAEWAAIRKAASPAPQYLFLSAVDHFARGMEAAHRSSWEEAESELRLLRARQSEMPPSKYGLLCQAARIYSLVLTAAIGQSISESASAVEQAYLLENELPYDEPPMLYSPVRMQLMSGSMAASKLDVIAKWWARPQSSMLSLSMVFLLGIVAFLRRQKPGSEINLI